MRHQHFARRHREETWPPIDSSVGEKHIETIEFAGSVIDRGAQRRPVSHVDNDTADLASLRAKFCDRRGKTGVIDIEQRDGRAVIGHGFGIGIPNAARAPCYDGDEASDVEKLDRFIYRSLEC